MEAIVIGLTLSVGFIFLVRSERKQRSEADTVWMRMTTVVEVTGDDAT